MGDEIPLQEEENEAMDLDDDDGDGDRIERPMSLCG